MDGDHVYLPTQEQLDEHEREQNDGSHKPPSDRPKVTKFRFKSSRSKRRRDRDDDDDDDRDHHHHRHNRRHRHRSEDKDDSTRRGPSRRSHRHRGRSKSPSPPRPPKDPFAPDPLDPETAFRESLFDAMADDEGAAYWEGIYGQPIHIYPPPNPDSNSSSRGHLEQMTDDQYADYVLRKMWEKTHAGLLEARARREKEKHKQKEEDEQRRRERMRIEKEMETSLAKGEERRRRRKWEGYLRKWDEWDGLSEGGIPWPEGVGGADVGEVSKFFEVGLEGVEDKVGRLKEERVRWHPDKMLQRFGGKVGEGVMKDVTAVFQVVDGLLGDLRKRSSGGRR
ncbi:hypothetical protein QBC44DRAFT_319200 [Cladorrhinum sp. PSN332]|nr:hypothetical protein QBC44DRAFT_319200 [Cladorrhinum sp. PSN332]